MLKHLYGQDYVKSLIRRELIHISRHDFNVSATTLPCKALNKLPLTAGIGHRDDSRSGKMLRHDVQSLHGKSREPPDGCSGVQ